MRLCCRNHIVPAVAKNTHNECTVAQPEWLSGGAVRTAAPCNSAAPPTKKAPKFLKFQRGEGSGARLPRQSLAESFFFILPPSEFSRDFLMMRCTSTRSCGGANAENSGVGRQGEGRNHTV